MNNYILNEYLKKITKKDVNNFAKKEGITLTLKELDILYYYIKNRYKEFLSGNHIEILEELKTKLEPSTYKKIRSLYDKYKYKLP